MQLELKALQQEVGITFVYVTHDQEEALTMSDVIVVMRDGRIQQMGAPNELYERPTNTFVANFIGLSNFVSARLVSHDRATAHAVVETDRGLRLVGHVTDPEAMPEDGANVTVAVRPERLSVEAGSSNAGPADTGGSTSSSGLITIPGRIRQGTYLGDQTEYRIETDAGELIVRRQNASGAGPDGGIGPGEPVVVRWNEESNLILAG
jgi:ABC-type Fe3+/spermidine/putrescine transport system ATPase subunit